jgi:hypothetical protein
MVFPINKILNKLGANIIVEFDEPFKNVSRIIRYIDRIDGLSNTSKISREFAVSYDNKEWSLREKLTDMNLLSYIDISKDFYLKLYYKVIEKYDTNPIIINQFELIYDNAVVEEEMVTAPTEGLNILNDINYDVDMIGISEYAEKIESATNYFINKTSPIEVLYFRHEPDLDTQDVFLNEYSIHNEVDRKCLKVIIDENSLPDRNIQFNEWGIDFDKFVVYIDKTYFEEIFGKNTKPRNNDYAFFQKSNRMYYIHSNELVAGANEGAESYELSLKKYDEDTSVKKTESTTEFLDENTISREKLFGEQMEVEMEDMTNPQQNLTKFISDDGVREEINELMNIVEERVYNNKIELMKSFYDLTRIPDDEVAVKYRTEHEILANGGWSMMAWIKKFDTISDIKFDIINQRRINTHNIELGLSESNELLKLKEDGYIMRGSDIYYISEIIDDTHIKILSRNFLETQYLDDYVGVTPINLISSIGLDTSFRVDIVDTNILIINNDNIHRFNNVPNMNDEWKCVFVNISNAHNHVGAYVWSMDESPDDILSTALVNIYKKEYVINDVIAVNKVVPFITGSNCNYGNLRIFKRTIDIEHHSYIASHKTIKKPSTAYIIDDCQLIFNYPKISKGNIGIEY